jgi:ABC-type glutathione transport system ATPase component
MMASVTAFPALTRLDVRDVSKTFVRRRGFWATPLRTAALAGVSLDVGAGEILGVVGESGSGKTTLGRIIVGLETADGGTITLGERVLASAAGPVHVAAASRGIGMIFQDPYSSLNGRMRVRDIVGEGLRIAGRLGPRELNERVDGALSMVGLRPADRERYPHQFSGGQRQRIGIARAIAMEPRLLIADEAVSSLDVSVQMQVLNVLLDIRDKLGLALMFITHNIGVVEYLCDRVVVLARGEIVESGPTRTVIGAPQHAYTQKLIEAIPRL